MVRKLIEKRLRRPGRDKTKGDAILSFFEGLYFKLTEKRNKAFDQQGLHVKKLPCPVISIGNLVAGGTGKTPMTRAIAEILTKNGIKVAILSRGYGGKFEKKGARVSDGKTIFLSAREAGDEPYLLARTSPASVYVGKNRYKSGCEAIKDGAEILLLDDGFQHRKLHRDLDILLMDAKSPLGNGRLLPRGILRESPWNLNRCDAIIFTRSKNSDENPREKIKYFLKKNLAGKIRTFSAGEDFFWCEDYGGLPKSGEKVFAFSGIAEPENFFRRLGEKGLFVQDFRSFPDHYAYRKRDLQKFVNGSRKMKADALVTTLKDAVKIPDDFFTSSRVLVADVAPVFFERKAFENWLTEKLSSLFDQGEEI